MIHPDNNKGAGLAEEPHHGRDCTCREWKILKSKPDLMLILMAVFGMGVVVTLMLPMAANNTVAAPASGLQAGVIIQD